MARSLGPELALVEYGSGSSVKTRLLLDRLVRPAAYVPVDVSREHLFETALALRLDYPGLPVEPVCADFAAPFALPRTRRRPARRAVYFPGSTIGNFSDSAALALMAGVARRVGPGGALLVGVDLKKDPRVLERAYDDARGVTAAFNLNLLARMNRELDADFDLARFSHRALWLESASRIEMHLVSEVRAGRAPRRPRHPLRARREHLHGALAQVHARRLRAARATRGSRGEARLDRPRAALQCAVSGGAGSGSGAAGSGSKRSSGARQRTSARRSASLVT